MTNHALEAEKFFKSKFGYKPAYQVQAPGRLELLGNHTDYNQGLVMSIAVDKHVHIVASPRTDGKIELVSSAFPQREKFSLSDIRKSPEAPWADYVKGVLLQLRRQQVVFGGFDAAIHSSIPMGAGMSSSAALEVATALIVRQLFPYTITETACTKPPKRNALGVLPPVRTQEKLHLARLCQRAENQFVGVNCGLLDQISSLYGKAFHAILIDCQHLTVEHVPLIGEIGVVICNSGVKHALVGGEYNDLRRQCESAAKDLGVKSLRQIEMPQLKTSRPKLTDRQFQCAMHVVGEIQRVVFGERALREDDFTQFGMYMFQSHESSRFYFKNSTPELDLLVELAQSHPATLGARLTGGGFGGATINLVRRQKMDAFSRYMAAKYEKCSGHAMTPFHCQVVDGAQ